MQFCIGDVAVFVAVFVALAVVVVVAAAAAVVVVVVVLAYFRHHKLRAGRSIRPNFAKCKANLATISIT